MKLKNENIDSIDLKEEEKKTRWAEEILDKFTTKIPLMTSIAKNTGSTHFNFIGLARHGSLAESLIFKSNRFKNTSEVYRAAMYIGMSIIYQLTKDEGTPEQKARADGVYKIIQVMESVNHSRQIIDAVVLSARDVIECADSGVIDFEEMKEKVSTLIDSLPKELHPIASDKIKKIMAGDNIVDIMETKIHRGAKGMKKRSV
jgi:hypothetical protein